MSLQIRIFNEADLCSIVELSLQAWGPALSAWENILGSELHSLPVYDDWRKCQKEIVENRCTNNNCTTWVAEQDEDIVGFVTYIVHDGPKHGEICLLAVHPSFQKKGIGTRLKNLALQNMRDAGIRIAQSGTGGAELNTTQQ